jgi:hypothetical protein
MTALDWGWSVNDMAAQLMIESAKAHLDLRLKSGTLQPDGLPNVTAGPISYSLERRPGSIAMQVNVQIPDDIGRRLTEAGADLSRRALEAFALEELKAGRITEPELCQMLGLARLQVDGFLKAHGVYENITLDDVDRDIADLKALGF